MTRHGIKVNEDMRSGERWENQRINEAKVRMGLKAAGHRTLESSGRGLKPK